MNDGEEDGRGINVGKVDQGRPRRWMGEVEGKDDSGRSWPGAVDMFQDRFTTFELVWRQRSR